MKFNAIICEFNPFTKGHEYIINEIKKLSSNPIVCIMSGNFVQRGEPAILDKYERASHAIKAGADIVIELPTIYALSSAPDFAFGAIKTLNALNCIETLYFGSESGNLETLFAEAEKELGSEILQGKLRNGTSFASASVSTSNILNHPNNILAVEYLRALKKTNSTIKPYTIKRNNNYNQKNITNLPSATALRELLNKNNYIDFCKNSPEFAVCDKNTYKFSLNIDNLIEFKIKSVNPAVLSNINGVCEGVEFRIVEAFNRTGPITEKIKNINTKRYPEGKIKRILLNALLDINKDIVINAKNTNSSYIKILAINKDKTNLLSQLPNDILITSKKDLLKLSMEALNIINIDINASKIYSCIKNTYNPLSDFTIGFKKI